MNTSNGELLLAQIAEAKAENLLEDQSIDNNEPSSWMRWDVIALDESFVGGLQLIHGEVMNWHSSQKAQGLAKQTRRPKDTVTQAVFRAVGILCSNLYINYLIWPQVKLRTPKGNGSTTHIVGVGSDTFKIAYNGLLQLGYFELTKRGHKGEKSREFTRTLATSKLIQVLSPSKATIRDFEFPIKSDITIRNDEKQNFDYLGHIRQYDLILTEQDKSYLNGCKEKLATINRVTTSHWVDLCVSDKTFTQIQNTVRASHSDGVLERRRYANGDIARMAFVDLTQNQYRRVFNNESTKMGGRFYGVWWQSVPKDYRRYITINGSRTVELDYHSLHPSMVYAIVGKKMGNEPYKIDLAQCGVDSSNIGNYDKKWRPVVKRLFNAMLNARRGPIEEFNDYKEEGRASVLSWDNFLEAVEDKFADIRPYLYSGIGVELQWRDSNMAEEVMMHFARRGIVCLCVHDSFIVEEEYGVDLRVVMMMAYLNEMEVPTRQPDAKHSEILEGLNWFADSEYRQYALRNLPNQAKKQTQLSLL